MVSNLQIFLISVPVMMLAGIQSASSFFIRVAVIWINDFAVITIIFGNLMLSVHRNFTENLSVGSAIGSFVRRESRSKSTGDQGPRTSTIQGNGDGDNDSGHSSSRY